MDEPGPGAEAADAAPVADVGEEPASAELVPGETTAPSGWIEVAGDDEQGSERLAG